MRARFLKIFYSDTNNVLRNMPLRFLHRVMFEVRTFFEQVLLLSLQQPIGDRLLQNIFSGGDLPDGFLLKQYEGHQRFFWDIDLRPQILAMLTENNSDALSLIVDEADRVYAHIFDLLGSGPVYLGEKIDWHMDFKVGHHWNPRTYYKRIRPAPYPGGYDIKVPWELSRCQHFARLGQAYWITENEKYAQEFVSQVEDWIASNPWPWGVNWACTMDVAIRVVNWLWGYYFFKDSPTLHDEFRLAFFKSLLVHGRHIWRNLENHGITTNHYLADLVGLVYLGILCPEFGEAKEWREFALKELWQELVKQVHADGTGYEGSIAYHRLVTECYLSVIILCRLNSISVPDWVRARLEKMLEFVMDYTKSDGTVPLLGDADNGRLHRLTVWHQPELEWLDHRYLLAIGAVLFGRRDFALAAGGQWQEALWLCNQLASSIDEYLSEIIPCNTEAVSPVVCVNYLEGGFHIAKNKNLFLIVRGGSIGTAGVGNHTHNDALSFEWFSQGVTLIRDAGAGIYTADYKLRNVQRSVRSHSTICIDGREPCALFARRPFSLSGKRAVDGKIQSQSDAQGAEGNFTLTGYQGMPPGFCIQRQIKTNQEGDGLSIVDTIEGSGVHIIEHAFVLGDVSLVTIAGTIVSGLFNTGTLRITFVSLSSPSQVWTEKIWLSDGYGNFVEGYVVRCREEAVLPFRAEMHLQFVKN